MRAMRKFESKDIAPEDKRSFEVRYGNAGVIRGDDAKWDRAQRFTYFATAITLSSIAIGVGREMISIVVRVGFGLSGPAKCSA